MIGLLGKIDGIVIAAIGGAGWFLKSNDEDSAAIVLALFVGAVTLVGLVGTAAIRKVGGHQSPPLAVTVGHLSPSLVRAGLLVVLGWVGAWAVAKTGVESEEASASFSAMIFGLGGQILKPIREAVDALRPMPFGKSTTQACYKDKFVINPANHVLENVNAYNAVQNDPAEIYDSAGVVVERIDGWALKGRERRLEVIAEAL